MTTLLLARESDQAGLGAICDAWLFTRGAQSVRIIRAWAASHMFLYVYGPDSEIDSHIFDDAIGCMRYQADV